MYGFYAFPLRYVTLETVNPLKNSLLCNIKE